MVWDKGEREEFKRRFGIEMKDRSISEEGVSVEGDGK